MKGRYLILFLLFSLSSFCKTTRSPEAGDTTKSDTTGVNVLLMLSKKNRWIDSYRSLDYASRALGLAQKLHYKKGIASANNLKGFCFWTFGDNDLAILAAMEGQEIARTENYPLIQAESYYILACGYMDIAERKIAQESIRKAEALANKSKNWELLCSIYNLRGVILFIDNKRDSALQFYNKAFDIGKDHSVDSVNFPRIISNIGECYAVQDPAKAFTYYERGLALARQTSNRIAEASITDVIGHALLRKNDLQGAEANLQSSLQLARHLGLRRVIRHSYAGLVDIKLQLGRGDEAVVYLKRYYEVRDSLLNTSKIRQIVELEAKHELQLKEQDIKILEGEKRIQTLSKNLLIVVVIVLILLSASVYQLQKYRYRKNREMLNLEIDYLTRRHKETEDKYRAKLFPEPDGQLESHDQQVLKKAISVVEDNIADPLFGVEKMAVEMNMSRTNLHRKIKAITGFPPGELIRSIRLRKAAKLILNRVDSATQIALLVGFDDYPHFSKSFKKHFGVTPTGYEEQARNQRSSPQEAPEPLKN